MSHKHMCRIPIERLIPRYRWKCSNVLENCIHGLRGKTVIMPNATCPVSQIASKALSSIGLQVRTPIVDYKSFSVVRSYAESFVLNWKGPPLHAIVHHCSPLDLDTIESFSHTENDHERLTQITFLSPVLLTQVLSTRLSKGSRVISVASMAHRFVDDSSTSILSALQTQQRADGYNGWKALCTSNAALIAWSHEANRRIQPRRGIAFTVAQLGPSKSLLERMGAPSSIISQIIKSDEERAATLVWAVVSKELELFGEGRGGIFLENCSVQTAEPPAVRSQSGEEESFAQGTCPFVHDATLGREIWDYAQRAVR